MTVIIRLNRCERYSKLRNYINTKLNYKQSQKLSLLGLETFLNSIEINKQYFRTGIQVKILNIKKSI